MQLSPQTRLDISKVLTITVAYVLFSLFLAIYDHVMIATVAMAEYPVNYSLPLNLLIHAIVGLIAGLFGGSLLVIVNKKVFRKNSLGRALLRTAGIYLLVYVVITVVVSSILEIATGTASTNPVAILTSALQFVAKPSQLIFVIVWGAVCLLTLFLLQVYDKFGPGILRKFLLGQYFQPRKEQRIFMFLDMRSSTSIAEKIGTEQYFRLLRECFSVITKPIIDHGGEIYQYVGDEIVISWLPSQGFRDARCLRCYDAIQKRMTAASNRFEDVFGLVPEFKAGLHFGDVVAGEIGEIKKDIVYSGDVLNATSRIQDLCNRYKENFLASSDALNQMKDHSPFEFVSIGELELRGRKERISVHAVHAVA